MKNGRKLTTLLLCMALALSMCASASAAETGYQIIDKEYTIAWIGWGDTDYVGGSITRYLKYLDEQMPEIKVVYSDAGLRGSDAQVADAEAFCQSGVDAIIAYLPSVAMADVCKQHGVWLGAGTNLVTDQELIAYLESTGIWLGYNPHGREYEEGWRAVQALYDCGDRNFIVLGSQPGHPAGDERIRGMQECLASLSDVNVLGVAQSSDSAQSLADLVALHGTKIQAVAMTSSAQGGGVEGAVGSLMAAGVNAHIAVLDMCNSAEQLFEADILKYMSAGNMIDAGSMIVPAINALTGNYQGPVYIYPEYIPMYNNDDLQKFLKGVDGAVPPFTADELRAWMRCYNPDATDQGYVEYIQDNLTLDSILERHKDLY